MIKYFCDKCGKEFTNNRLYQTDIYIESVNNDPVIIKKQLCVECRGEVTEKIKDIMSVKQ